MNIQKNKAFTLVELIVVVTILAILGTIAFISFQGYSRSARNSRRIADVANIKISLALFNTRVGRYPEPENITNITYLGAMVRSEGIMGETVVRQLRELPKVPLDPLLDIEYAYSILNTKKEYEVGTIVEGESGIIGFDNKLLNNTYADSNINFAYIKGTYNGIVAKVSTGGIDYALAVPTIIGSDLNDPNYEALIDNKLLSYDGYQNLPSSYSGTNLTMTGGFDFGGTSMDVVLYSGSIDDLSDNTSDLKIFGDNLKTAYSGTDLSSVSQYAQILSMDTNDSNELNSVAGNIVNNYLGGNVKSTKYIATLTKTSPSNTGPSKYEAGDVITITLNGNTLNYTLTSADVSADDNVLFTSLKNAIDSDPTISALVDVVVTDKNTLTLISKNSGLLFTVSAEITTEATPGSGTDTIISSTDTSSYSCDDSTKPADNGHITYTIGTPTTVNQAYVQNASNCGYSCTDGYSGIDCSVAPIITNTTCTDAGWYWIDSSNDVYIGINKGNGFCISPRFGDWNSDSATGNGGISWNGWGNNTYDYMKGWDSSSIDDNGNPNPDYGQTRILDTYSGYSCKSLGTASSDFIISDTIQGRMKWLATTGNSYIQATNIDWIINAIPPNGHVVPALFIADCIDGVKDLGTTMGYTGTGGINDEITYTEYSYNVLTDTSSSDLFNLTYQNRQKYLTAWTQRKGSHLPSAFSYITNGYSSAKDEDGSFLIGADRGEYQIACELGILADSDIDAIELIWLSAIGNAGTTINGKDWGRNARINYQGTCGSQSGAATGFRFGTASARFVVRP